MAGGHGEQELVEVNGRVMSVALACAALACAGLAGCGQTGDLYLPEPAREIVTRPAATPPPADAPQAPNTPGTVDSPVAQPSPAPEVAAPPKDEQAKKKPDSPR
jgi:predicted small lipoprotein YifL